MAKATDMAAEFRLVIDEYDWGTAGDIVMDFYDEVDRHKTFRIVLGFIRQYELIDYETNSNIDWLPVVLDLMEKGAPTSEIRPLMGWIEFQRWDHNGYFSAIESLCWAYFKLNAQDDVAKEKLLEALQAISNAHRYKQWIKLYPHLQQFWGRGYDDRVGMLASLSYGRDPILQAYMREKYLWIADQMAAFDKP